MAMVCCMMMLTVEARGAAQGSSIDVDWDLVAVFMGLLMILGGLILYEALRWGFVELYYQYLPGATTRRMKRLQRLRDATTAAIEKELARATSRGWSPPAEDLHQTRPNKGGEAENSSTYQTIYSSPNDVATNAKDEQ